MHELSIVSCIVDTVTESLAAYPGVHVKEVRLRVGVMAAVVEDSLQFCYGVVTQGTPLAGSALVVKTLPIKAHCTPCDRAVEIASIQSMRCPHCGTPSTQVLQGRELEVEAIEIEEPEGKA